MGSYISIAFVSNDTQKCFIGKCKKIIQLNTKNITSIILKYPKDENFNLWYRQNENISNISEALKLCFKNEYAELIIDYISNDIEAKGILIKIKKKKGKYTGLLFEIPEDSLKLEKNVDEIEKRIISNIKDYVKLGFEYAFCDHEMSIEYSLSEITNNNIVYSILVANGDTIITKFASWKIDGLTYREQL